MSVKKLELVDGITPKRGPKHTRGMIIARFSANKSLYQGNGARQMYMVDYPKFVFPLLNQVVTDDLG